MGAIRKPPLVKLIIGILSGNAEQFDFIRPLLAEKFGREEETLEPFPFTFTNYYKEDLGDSPWRSFVSYETLINREEMVDIKLWTNDLELKIAKQNGTENIRPINLDPGYMALGQFFLATTKDQRQRVYIRDGIFVEPTLYFQDGHFHPFDWTYRDYQSEEYISYLEKVRAKFAFQRSFGRPYRERLTNKKA